MYCLWRRAIKVTLSRLPADGAEDYLDHCAGVTGTRRSEREHVFLTAFAGFDQPRNQSGVTMATFTQHQVRGRPARKSRMPCRGVIILNRDW